MKFHFVKLLLQSLFPFTRHTHTPPFDSSHSTGIDVLCACPVRIKNGHNVRHWTGRIMKCTKKTRINLFMFHFSWRYDSRRCIWPNERTNGTRGKWYFMQNMCKFAIPSLARADTELTTHSSIANRPRQRPAIRCHLMRRSASTDCTWSIWVADFEVVAILRLSTNSTPLFLSSTSYLLTLNGTAQLAMAEDERNLWVVTQEN